MRYWVTTQWPHSIEENLDEPHYGIYIPDGRENAVKKMRPGDIVFIYESRTGRTEKRHLIDGSTKMIYSHPGKEGIVTIVKVNSDVYSCDDTDPTEYTDGTNIWWRFKAETEHITGDGFISRTALNKVLGYAKAYNLHGFGDKHSGIKEISKAKADELIKLFVGDIDTKKKRILGKEQNNKKNHSYGGTGEGEIHRRIKYAIQDNPEKLLCETGLKHIKTEYSFITSDRVDLLLIDTFGKYVVVEVEPECVNGNEIGSAQCMKYRSLLAFENNLDESEVRSILAAPIIDQDIINKAKSYGIEVCIIDMHLTTAST